MTSTHTWKKHVFVSYASEDRAKADQICRGLEAEGFPIFVDHEMASGVRWERVLSSQLEKAYAVVVIWSSRSVASEWVAREATVGLEKDRLFPLLVERGVTIPSPFAHIHGADLTDWNGDADDPRFKHAIWLLRAHWEAQEGLLKDGEKMKTIHLVPGSK